MRLRIIADDATAAYFISQHGRILVFGYGLRLQRGQLFVDDLKFLIQPKATDDKTDFDQANAPILYVHRGEKNQDQDSVLVIVVDQVEPHHVQRQYDADVSESDEYDEHIPRRFL